MSRAGPPSRWREGGAGVLSDRAGRVLQIGTTSTSGNGSRAINRQTGIAATAAPLPLEEATPADRHSRLRGV